MSGLTLRALASRAGVSASLMSQIETGKVDPSLNTMRRIAMALGVPLFHLVLEELPRPANLTRPGERRKVVFPKAGLEYEIINSDLNRKIGVMIGVLEAGGATSEEPLAHPDEECLVILKGSLKVQIANQITPLLKGDSLYFDSSVPHRLFNDGGLPCKFMLIITPPKF